MREDNNIVNSKNQRDDHPVDDFKNQHDDHPPKQSTPSNNSGTTTFPWKMLFAIVIIGFVIAVAMLAKNRIESNPDKGASVSVTSSKSLSASAENVSVEENEDGSAYFLHDRIEWTQEGSTSKTAFTTHDLRITTAPTELTTKKLTTMISGKTTSSKILSSTKGITELNTTKPYTTRKVTTTKPIASLAVTTTLQPNTTNKAYTTIRVTEPTTPAPSILRVVGFNATASIGDDGLCRMYIFGTVTSNYRINTYIIEIHEAGCTLELEERCRNVYKTIKLPQNNAVIIKNAQRGDIINVTITASDISGKEISVQDTVTVE